MTEYDHGAEMCDTSRRCYHFLLSQACSLTSSVNLGSFFVRERVLFHYLTLNRPGFLESSTAEGGGRIKLSPYFLIAQ